MALRDVRGWLASPWPLMLTFVAAAMAWVLAFGNPLEISERRWLDSALRIRYAFGWAPAGDPAIVVCSIDDEDFAKFDTLEREYAAAEQLIDDAFALGGSVVGLDVIYSRGTSDRAERIAAMAEESIGLCLRRPSSREPGGGGRVRLRSFSHRPIKQAIGGLINIEADRDGVYRSYHLLQAAPDGPSLRRPLRCTLQRVEQKTFVLIHRLP